MSKINFINITILLVLFSGCAGSNKEKKLNLEIEYLFGEWRSDWEKNSTNSTLFFLEDSSYYSFSDDDGGSLNDSGYLFSKDSIKGLYFWKYKYEFFDTNEIFLIDDYDDTSYYRRSNYPENYLLELKKRKKSSKLRSKIIGWWKLKSKQIDTTYFSVPNYPYKCDSFTINIRDNGDFYLYKNNYLDSLTNYSYRMDNDKIELVKGCGINKGIEVKVINQNEIEWIANDYLPSYKLKFKRITRID